MDSDQQHQVAEHGAEAQLRRSRPRARWSLGSRERRARQELTPALPSAQTIAMEQLAHVREVTQEQAETLVLDLASLKASDAAEAVILRLFTDDIVSRRRTSLQSSVVFVRAEDQDVLAGLLSCQPDDVAPMLRNLRVLAD